MIFSKVFDVIDMGGRTEKWIACLIAGLNEHVDEKTRATILEQCGRQCQSKLHQESQRHTSKIQEHRRILGEAGTGVQASA
jgi:hypothetical protein